MVSHHWQQLRFVFTVPGADCTPGRGAFCFEASPAEKDFENQSNQKDH